MSEAIKKWIADYDSGKKMQSVIMGGIDESYEIPIQEYAVQALRYLQYEEPSIVNAPMFKEIFERASEVAYANVKGGYSGAQVAAAMNIASVFWLNAPVKAINMMADIDKDRITYIWKKEDGALGIEYPQSPNPEKGAENAS